MASFALDSAGLRAVLEGPQGPVWQDIQRRSNRVLSEARRRAPVDQGQLRASLAMEMRVDGSSPVGRVGTNLPYGLYVHEGTGLYSKRRPGYIVPVRRKALRWAATNNSGAGRRRYKAGATAAYVYSKRSKGSPGRPFLRDALAAANKPI